MLGRTAEEGGVGWRGGRRRMRGPSGRALRGAGSAHRDDVADRGLALAVEDEEACEGATVPVSQ